jgi:hypothetical protein
MGRGRQKAKQTKVARDLKYSTHAIDVTALQRELSTSEEGGGSHAQSSDEDYDDYQDAYGTGR